MSKAALKFTQKWSIFLALVFVLAMSRTASAVSLCTSGTMATYANTTCTIGNFQFSFGGTVYIYGPGDVSVPASAVTVTPYGAGTANDPTGFTFSANNWTTTNATGDGLTSADINLTFDALLLAPLPYNISNTALTLNVSIANETGNSGVLAGENVTNNLNSSSLGSIDLTVLGNTDASSLLLDGTPLSGIDYFKARGVNINKDINLVAFDQNKVQVNSILETFTYSTVPEPGAFIMTGVGIGLLFLIRRRKQILSTLGLIALITVAGSAAHATPLCTSGTVQDYINAGQCSLGGITFTFTASSYTFSGTGTAPAASGIAVTPILANHQIGFQFTPNSPAVVTTGTQTEQITLTYTAKAIGEQITSFTAHNTASTHGTGTLAGSKAKLANGATTLSTVTFPNTTSGGGVGTPAFASVIPGTLLTITNTFSLSSSGTSLSNNTHLSNFTNTVTATPEPVTSMLCGAGLLVVGLAFRSRKTKK